jgi:NAD(P)-dependent dehydrogenase (short-subunit alcohol dehydrogenase family)
MPEPDRSSDVPPAPTIPVVLIAGATGPLGRAAAAGFAAEGAAIGILGSDLGRLEALAADLDVPADRLAFGVGDLRTRDGTITAIQPIIDRFGRVDILLQLVGGWTGGTALIDLQADVIEDMLARHVWSTFHLAQAVVPGMVERSWGRVIAVTSTTAARPGPAMAAYVAAKAAQGAMLRSLARDVAPSGVTVNIVAVRTIDAEHAREREPSKQNAGWTTPEEIVATIRHLCSEDAAAVNGAIVPLDGRG